MPDLIGFQHDFLDAITTPQSQLSALSIYRNTAVSAAVDALADNYPVVRAIVGEEMFGAVAFDYVGQHPPMSPVLALYGDAFAEWLEEQPYSQELSYLADTARCERLRTEALFAADAPALEGSVLTGLDQGDLLPLRPTLHPATRFTWLSTPAMAIWLAHQEGAEQAITPEWRPGGALFTRPGWSVEGRAIDAATHRLLFGIRIGETLGAAATAAAALYPDADIGASFSTLIQSGAFASLQERT